MKKDTFLYVFATAKENSKKKESDFKDKKEYIAARNKASDDRRMAFTLMSAIAFGGQGVSESPSTEITAWMRSAEVGGPLLNPHSWQWHDVVVFLGSYIRFMRMADAKYKKLPKRDPPGPRPAVVPIEQLVFIPGTHRCLSCGGPKPEHAIVCPACRSLTRAVFIAEQNGIPQQDQLLRACAAAYRAALAGPNVPVPF